MMKIRFVAALAALALAGCAYSWKSAVPQDARTVAVPVFRNSSDISELGSVVTREVLREFQREGTYSLARVEDAALEIQGEIKSAGSSSVAYERRTGARNRERRLVAKAVVSFVDRKSGRVLANNRAYKVETTFLANDDVVTGERDASGRIGEELARRIVDDALGLKW